MKILVTGHDGYIGRVMTRVLAEAGHDDEAGTLELVRTDYDIARAQEKILEAGLPAFLAARLQHGH